MNEVSPITTNDPAEEQTFRIKTAMVLYAFERSLGRFVLDAQPDVSDLRASIVDEIEKRREPGMKSHKLTLRQTIEETYLSEIFQLALDAAENTATSDRLVELKELCSTLEIYRIRNAISHPNRTFPECYFHRIAAIATDPLTELLGLNDVLLSFRCAEKGQLDEPPEEWLNELVPSVVPNNVPTEHDHALTGLVGRKVEISQLRQLLSNERVNTIAITAPGGTGKTALILEALHEISLDTSFQETISCIVFLSLRTEKLTATGVQKLSAVETLDELEAELGKSLQEIYDLENSDFLNVMEILSDQKILLCIDNLETVIRDNAQSFEEFDLKLPQVWRVLVTSRVSVPSATTLPLEQLKRNAACHLTRSYAGRSGAGKIDEAMIDKIVATCNCNPLAIRLTVDLYNLGRSIQESLGIATRNTLDFSFKNLVNALSPYASQVLESLFLKDRSNVPQLAELLQLNLEETTEAIRELLRTSLVSRTTTDISEEYGLNSSIRDLLLVNPTDLEFRQNLAHRVQRQQTLAKEVDAAQETRDTFDFFYIPDTCPAQLKLLLAKSIPVLAKKKKDYELLKNELSKYKQSESLYDQNALFHRFYGRILWYFKDKRGWERHYNRSLELEPNSPVTKSTLAHAYREEGMYEEARVLYLELLEAGWGEVDKWKYWKLLIQDYCKTLLYGKQYDDLLEFTKKWKESGELKEILGTFRATTWKRKIEKLHWMDPEKAADGLRRAVRIMNDVLLSTGYNKQKISQARNIVKEIIFVLSRSTIEQNSELALEWLEFAERHLQEIYNQFSAREIREMLSSLTSINNEKNPFKSSRWNAFRETFEVVEEDNLKTNDGEYINVRVCNIPTVSAGFPNFLFVEDGARERYFVHFGATIDNDWDQWKTLRIGSVIGIIPSEDQPKDGRSRSAVSAMFI